MTLNELKSEVAALGFEEDLADDRNLVIFSNRALRKIFADRQVLRTVKVCIPKKSTASLIENVSHFGGNDLIFPLNGRAYCIEVSGEGYFTIKAGNNETRYDFDTDGSVFKNFTEQSGSITFSGEHSYLIRKIAVFKETYGSDTDSIPDGSGRLDINIAKMYGDFLCFTGAPKDARGNPIYTMEMSDGVITIPDSFYGEFYVTYRRAPSPINQDTPESEIDITEDMKHLLPLLSASYICLECDPEHAEYYNSLYKEEMKMINKSSRRNIDCRYYDVNGWA